MERKVVIKSVTLNTRISDNELKYLRGAIIKLLEAEENILLHNHTDNNGGLRYLYPLVQYRRLDGLANIVCIGEAACLADIIEKRFNGCIQLGKRLIHTQIKETKQTIFIPQIKSLGYKYKICRWQPLSSENFSKYKKLIALTDKIVFLEQIMIGNILGLYKGLGVCIESEVFCNFTKLSEPSWDKYKEVSTMFFDVEIISNYALPEGCGIGKGISIGCGNISSL